MLKSRRGRRTVLFGSLAAAAAAATVALIRAEDGSMSDVRKAGAIRIGYAVEAPYAFVADGKVTGVSPETAARIAARLRLHVNWVQTNFGNLIGDLIANRFDVIAAGMFVTAERAARVSFSEPELRVRDGLLVASGNPLNLRSYAGIVANAQIRIAAVAGSIEHQRLIRRGVPAERLLVMPDAALAMAAVAAGAAQALPLSLPTVRYWAMRNPATVAVPLEDGDENGSPAYVAFAFRKDARALLAAWNGALAEILASDERMRAIAQFGFEPVDLPGDVTVRRILAS